jgi:hypothetical protein
LDVNELKGLNLIKKTKVLFSNDQDTTTTIDSINKTSFDDGQKWENKGLRTKGQNMLQDMLEARIFGVSNPLHPNIGGGNQNIIVLSHVIHPSPLHGWT